MKRIKDINGVTHFANTESRALCGACATDLLGEITEMKDTDERVNCPECTRLWFDCKSAKFGEVADAAYQAHLDRLTDDFFKTYEKELVK